MINKLILILLFTPILLFSNNVQSRENHNLYFLIANKVFAQDYEQALSISDSLIVTYPNNPMGYLFKAATIITRAIDFEDDLYLDTVKTLLLQAEEKNKLINSKKDNGYNRQAINGMIKAINAYSKYKNGNWLGALLEGYKAVLNFNEALLEDPNSPEALMAIGIYTFWKSKNIDWLPLVEDEKDKGIELLKNGLAKNSPFSFWGNYSLVWMLIKHRKNTEAIKICNRLLKENPESRLFLWAIARAYEDIDLNKSIEYYKKTLRSIRMEKMNGYNEITLLHIIAQLEVKRKNYIEAKSFIDKIEKVSKTLDLQVKKRLSSRLDRIQALKKKVLAELKNN